MSHSLYCKFLHIIILYFSYPLRYIYCSFSFAIFLQFRKPYVEFIKLIDFIIIIRSADESPCINTMIHITIDNAFTIAHIAHCSEKRSRYRKLATTDTTVVRESMNGRFPPSTSESAYNLIHRQLLQLLL